MDEKGRHFADTILESISLYENCFILINISTRSLC